MSCALGTVVQTCALPFLLATICSAWAVESDPSVHWVFFVPWTLATWATVRLSWRAGLHLALLTLLVWAGLNAQGLRAVIGGDQGDIIALYALARKSVCRERVC